MDLWQRSLSDAAACLQQFSSDPGQRARCVQASNILISALSSDKKLLICGNGGSLCDAQHFAEELTGRFRADRPPIAALACADPSHITCTANDYGFEHIFSRWITALAREGDVVLLLSTSGNSPNMLHAAAAARARGAKTIALLGKSGGQLLDQCDLPIVVPGATSDRIQELHMIILHIFVEAIEAALYPTP